MIILAAAVNSDTTINSLRLNGSGASVSIGATNTLGITSGMILANTAATGNIGISGGTLDFQGNEAIVVARNAMTISSNLSNGNGLTKHGLGTLTLAGSGANFHGHSYLEEGMTVINQGNGLGDGKTTVSTGASLALTNNITVAQDISIGGNYNALNGAAFGEVGTLDTANGFSSIGGNFGNIESLSGNNTVGNVDLSGGAFLAGEPANLRNNIAQPGLNTIGVAGGSTLTISGTITTDSGANGTVVKLGDGTLVLTHADNITTLIRQFGGVINVEANGALGGTTGAVFQLSNTRSTVGFSNNVKYTTTTNDRDLTQLIGYGVGSLKRRRQFRRR